MSEFTILRFNECNQGLMPFLKRHRFWLCFWIAAIVILFFNLGMSPSQGSEGRWLAVVREMILTGDYLHPTVNGNPYFDKPLLTYWLCLIPSWAMGGVSELTVRIPSAVFGLLALMALIRLAKILYGEQASRLTAWIMLTTYSFVHWARLGEADMENLAAVLMAVTVYFQFREKSRFSAYLLFWLICAAGAQMKGLAAVILPALLVFLDCLFGNRWKTHLNWKMFAGMGIGFLVYLIPFIPDLILAGQSAESGGLALAFRENLVRVFNPWDHKSDPCWIYFIYLPRLLIPWTLFFVLAFLAGLIRTARNWKGTGESVKWNLAAVIVIFLLFSVSKSRRVYYILPIVPYCVLMTSAFFAENGKDVFNRLGEVLLKIADGLIPVFGLIVLASLPILHDVLFPRIFPCHVFEEAPILLILELAAPAGGLAILIFWLIARRKAHAGKWQWFSEKQELNRIIPVFLLIILAVYASVIPLTNDTPALRQRKPFLLKMRAEIEKKHLTTNQLLFIYDRGSDESFYLNQKFPIPQISRDLASAEEMVSRLRETGGIVFFNRGKILRKDFPAHLRSEFIEENDFLILPPGVEMEPMPLSTQKKFQDLLNRKDLKKAERILNKQLFVKKYKSKQGEERK